MPDYGLNPEAARENANSLAAALGVDVEHAEELLIASALVTVDSTEGSAVLLAIQVSALLVRTLSHAGIDIAPADAALEIVIGRASPRSQARKLWVSANNGTAYISCQRTRFRHIEPLLPVVL